MGLNFDSGIEREKVGFHSDSGISIFQCPIGPSIVRGWDRDICPQGLKYSFHPPPLSMVEQAFIGAPNIHFRAGKKSGPTRTTAGNLKKYGKNIPYFEGEGRGGF